MNKELKELLELMLSLEEEGRKEEARSIRRYLGANVDNLDIMIDFMKVNMDRIASILGVAMWEEFEIEKQDNVVFMLTDENGMGVRDLNATTYYYDVEGLLEDLLDGVVNIKH